MYYFLRVIYYYALLWLLSYNTAVLGPHRVAVADGSYYRFLFRHWWVSSKEKLYKTVVDCLHYLHCVQKLYIVADRRYLLTYTYVQLSAGLPIRYCTPFTSLGLELKIVG